MKIEGIQAISVLDGWIPSPPPRVLGLSAITFNASTEILLLVFNQMQLPSMQAQKY